VGAASLVVSFVNPSLALAGFGFTALLDASASVVLVHRFRTEQRDPVGAEHFERRAQAWVAVAMLAIASYVGVQAIRGLVGHSHPVASASGVTLAALSLVVLPYLGLRKLHVAARLGSAALRGDGTLTIASAALAATTLAALVVNSAFGWWWADPAAALLISLALAVEATRIAIRHRFG
jgi:divalent metal cation (Fe/Co/Zn/Cd) transporter